MKKRTTSFSDALITRSKKMLRNFKKDEDGSIIVFSLFLLIMMLILGGMAVDFMRFEARRTLMQGTIDRAVLAATKISDSTLSDAEVVTRAKAIVADYVAKADGPNCLKGEAVVVPGANFRSVTAECELELPSVFLKFVGIHSLTANAQATAIEGVGNVEVSLVVDLTGSMGWNITGTSTPRLERLQEAATAFVDTLLKPEYEDKISLSLVPYSSQVNAGFDLFNAVAVDRVHSFSSCVDFPNGSYSNVGWDAINAYTQAQHYRKYSSWNYTCRNEDYMEIIPLSQDKDQLHDAIDDFTAAGSTSIFLGIKWGAALLDPSMEPLLNALPSSTIDSAFDDRPFEYANIGTNGTKKYIVVMTDGENVGTEELRPEVYDTPSEIAHWATHSWSSHNSVLASARTNTYLHMRYSTADGNFLMNNICNAAKDAGIIIFAIAMDAPTVGEQEMSKCASSPGHYFETSGDELVAIFEAIASQITDLRLTL